MTERVAGCRLDLTAYRAVIAQYAAAGARYTVSGALNRDHATIALHGAKPSIRAFLDDMIAREAGCCVHLRFDIAELSDGYQVVLRVSGDVDDPAIALRQAVAALFPAAIDEPLVERR